MSRTFTLQDLQVRSLSELHVLRGALIQELALAAPYSAPAKQILHSLTVVDLAIKRRAPRGPRL